MTSAVKIKKKDGGENVQQQREGVLYTRNLILRAVSAVYLIAFVTFYHQSAGLFGNDGILPARLQLENIGTAKISAMHKKPTLLHLASFIGLDTGYMIDVLAILGAIISFTGFVSQKFCLLPIFAAMWSLYYSLIQVSQVFVNQADHLLLEAGFLCIILAPLNSHKKRSPVDNIGLVMLRWVLFRFTFASGVVKLASNCPQWWGLTALQHHFETLPLPTPLGWYVNYLPEQYMKLNVVFAFLSDLVIPWLYFFPNRVVRRFAFYWSIFLQFHIIITGNYGFLNFLVVSLLFALLDDSHFFGKKTKTKDIFGTIITGAIIAGILVGTYHFFGFALKNGEISFKILFSKQEYSEAMKLAIKFAPLIAFITIISTFMNTVVNHPSIANAGSCAKKILPTITVLLFTLISLGLVAISTVPNGNLHSATNLTNSQLGKIYKRVNHLSIVNEYGHQLTKMRTERFEISLEHSQNIEGPWLEYGYLYKPWNVNSSLPFSGPYLPRLDFKLYDAAVSNYNDDLWVTSLAYRLLQNNQNVLQLLGVKSKLKPSPKFVRASLYKFKYTPYKEKNNKAYWIREKVGEYFPAFALDHAPLQSYLKSLKISQSYKEVPVKNQFLKSVLDVIRKYSSMFEGSILILGILLAGFALIATQRRR